MNGMQLNYNDPIKIKQSLFNSYPSRSCIIKQAVTVRFLINFFIKFSGRVFVGKPVLKIIQEPDHVVLHTSTGEIYEVINRIVSYRVFIVNLDFHSSLS